MDIEQKINQKWILWYHDPLDKTGKLQVIKIYKKSRRKRILGSL